MTINQSIAFYFGALITIVITFFVLRIICVIFLENKRKKIFLKTSPDATPQEIDTDFQQYFIKFKTKLYVFLGILAVLIYIILSSINQS